MRTIKFEKMLTDLKKTIDRKEIDLLPPYVFSGEVKVIEEARQAVSYTHLTLPTIA